jgi:hypothetical protein
MNENRSSQPVCRHPSRTRTCARERIRGRTARARHKKGRSSAATARAAAAVQVQVLLLLRSGAVGAGVKSVADPSVIGGRFPLDVSCPSGWPLRTRGENQYLFAYQFFDFLILI